MTYNFKKDIEALLDVLFPPVCVACRAWGAWWCAACRSSLEWTGQGDLRAIDEADAALTMGFYHDPRLRAAVHALKYRGGACLLPDLVRAVQAWASSRDLPWANEESLAMQPLIAAPARVRDRGFDQSRLLVEGLGDVLAPCADVADLLVRRDSDIAQALLPDDATRAANVRGKFSVRPGAVVPEAVLLVDDVLTTGSTLAEAARVLRAGGVRRVYGFALAAGE